MHAEVQSSAIPLVSNAPGRRKARLVLRMKLAVGLVVPLIALTAAARGQMRPVDGALAPDSILAPTPPPPSTPVPAASPNQEGMPPPLPREKVPRVPKKKVSDLPDPKAREKPRFRPFTHVALAVKADSLGIGGELATPLSRSFNLRVGASLANLGYAFDLDGINYSISTHLKSGTGTIDWFPRHGGFHISPGVLYLESSVGGGASVPAGQYFSLGNTSFLNSIDDPVNGSATFKYSRKYSPMLLMGFGNLLPRSGRHLSVPFEFGVAYTGQAVIDVKLAGTACTAAGCFDAATDPQTQNALRQELTDINSKLKPYPIYPIISLGLAYRF